MKKLLSLALALIMVMSLATVAFAAKETEGVDYVNITKDYTLTGGTAEPNETLTFTIKKASTNPDQTKTVTVENVTVANGTGTIHVKVPTFTTSDKVGKYNFTITEQTGSTQGVGYTAGSFDVQVLAYWNDNHDAILTQISVLTNKTGSDAEKIDTVTNTFDMGSLKIDKDVTGNLADRTADFTIRVKLTTEAGKNVGNTITVGNTNDTKTPEQWVDGVLNFDVTLKHGQDITISNIPAGVSYEITEDSTHILAQGATVEANSAGNVQYTPTYTNATGTIASNVTAEASILNTKGTTVDTGITLDSLPFVLILAVCAVAAVLLVIKRRRSVEF